jgi:hypothetical protein
MCVILAYIEDRCVAVSASWTEEIVIIWLAIGIAIALEEVSSAELLITVVARKMLRMPLFSKSWVSHDNDDDDDAKRERENV